MSEQMTLEEYKRQIREHSIKHLHCSKEEVEESMKLYESDFQTFLDENWSVAAVATGMINSML